MASIGIEKWAEGQAVDVAWTRGDGDSRTRGYIRADGERAIETNGDPVFEGDAGFEEAWTGDTWTYEGYWNAVMGAHRDPRDVLIEFDLSNGHKDRDLDEWIGRAEAEAAAMGGFTIPESWGAFHGKAFDALREAIEVMQLEEIEQSGKG